MPPLSAHLEKIIIILLVGWHSSPFRADDTHSPLMSTLNNSRGGSAMSAKAECVCVNGGRWSECVIWLNLSTLKDATKNLSLSI